MELFHYEGISHPEIQFEYLLTKKPTEKGEESDSLIYSNNGKDLELTDGVQNCLEVESHQSILDNLEEGESRSFFVDDDGNLIEQIEVEIKNFG